MVAEAALELFMQRPGTRLERDEQAERRKWLSF
jgi:hypothetical protein